MQALNYSLEGCEGLYFSLCEGVCVCVCVFSFHLLGLACVFTCEEQRGVTEVESAVSRSAAQ